MATLRAIIGNHAYIAFEGDAGGGGTIGPSTPPADNAGEWRSVGCINGNDFQHEPQGGTEIFCPVRGEYTLTEEKFTSATTTALFTLNDITFDVWMILTGTVSVDGSGVGTPGAQVQPKKGWLKLQKYESGIDEPDDNIVNMQVWAQFTVPAATTFSQEVSQPQLQAKLLSNSLNSIQFLGSAAPPAP